MSSLGSATPIKHFEKTQEFVAQSVEVFHTKLILRIGQQRKDAPLFPVCFEVHGYDCGSATMVSHTGHGIKAINIAGPRIPYTLGIKKGSCLHFSISVGSSKVAYPIIP